MCISTNYENIGFDEYIGTLIVLIYHRYIGKYFYINIDNYKLFKIKNIFKLLIKIILKA